MLGAESIRHSAQVYVGEAILLGIGITPVKFHGCSQQQPGLFPNRRCISARHNLGFLCGF